MTEERLALLVESFLEGTLTAGERAELEAAVRSDPVLRERFLGQVRLHVRLHGECARVDEARAVELILSVDSHARRAKVWRAVEARVRARRSRANFPVGLWVAAAAAILIGLAYGMGRPPAPALRPAGPAVARPEPEDPPEPIAAPPAPPPAGERRPVSPPEPPAPRAPEIARPAPRGEPPPPAPGPARPLPPPPISLLPRPEARDPLPEKPPPPPTRPAPAVIARVVRAGREDGLAAGGAVETAPRATALVRFPDGTELRLEGATSAREFTDAKEGKRLFLAQGTISAEVTRQPAGRPFAILTPQAEARVLGTTLRLSVEADGTRLEVLKGRVRLMRLSDKKSVEVVAGHFAVAAAGSELVSRPVPPFVLRVSFGPANEPVPPDFVGDDGSPFDEVRGWGWSADFRQSVRLRAGVARDLLVRRHIAAGNAEAAARWEVAVPNGKYAVTAAVGDQMTAQGPHRVTIEGVPAIRDVFTEPGKHLVVENVLVDVRDGRLTVECGAVGSRLAARDGSSDTVINYIVITQVR